MFIIPKQCRNQAYCKRPDFSNPLTRGLTMFCCPGHPALDYNIEVKGQIPPIAKEQGIFGNYTGSGTDFIKSKTSGVLYDCNMTFMVGAINNYVANNDWNYLLGTAYDGSIEALTFRFNNYKIELTSYRFDDINISIGKDVPNDSLYRTYFGIVGVSNISDTWTVGYAGQDGIEQLTTGTASGFPRPGGIYIGAGAEGITPWRMSDKPILWAAIWDRKLSVQERKQMYENPWQIFDPIKRPIFFPATVSTSAKFRRTLSILGTRTGKRQSFGNKII